MGRIVYLLVCILVAVHGHAVLRDPIPFNTNPTTTRFCGVNPITDNMKSTPQAIWQVGTTVTITWQVVAGDGAGPVIGGLDTKGGTNFSTPLWNGGFTTTSTGTFKQSFTVPPVSCTAPNFCTFGISSSGWYSCSTVSVVNAAVPRQPPTAPQCKAISGRTSFCGATGSVLVSNGADPDDVDAELASVYSANLGNNKVFNGAVTSSACTSSYKTLLCSVSLTPCDPATSQAITATEACHGQCQQTMDDCGIVQAHIDLYPCSTYPLCPGESAGGSSGGMSPGGKAALSLFFIALAGVVGACGYLYYTKGHVLGYTFDKATKRIVKVQENPHNYKAYVDHDNS